MNKTIQTISDMLMQPDISVYLELSTAGAATVWIEFNSSKNQWMVEFCDGERGFENEADAVHYALEILRS